MIIDSNLVNELEELKVALEKDRYGVSLLRSARVKSMLKRESLDHSVYMEYPVTMNELRKKKGVSLSKKQQMRRDLRKTRNNLERAWIYGKTAFFEGDYLLNSDFLRDLNGAVQYGNPKRGMFRRENIRVIGSQYSRVSSEKVRRELEKLVEKDKQLKSDILPIERAANAHFHIAMIHPFEDGNGRTARLVQNLILDAAGYPPLVILAGERDYYGHLLDLAIGGHRLDDEHDMKPFFNYLASRLKVSLENMAGYPSLK